MSLDYNPKNINLAKELRKKSTKEEKHLWYDFLSNYQPKFQRQKAIDNFIVDFYCHRVGLVVEIDGSQHYTAEGKESDAFRTETLEQYDLTVIRFTNHQINNNFDGVCWFIDKTISELLEQGSLREGALASAGGGACE